MANQHTKQELLAFLVEKHLLTLATKGRNAIRCRCMFYANDREFNICLMATKDSVKLKELAIDPSVTMLIMSENEVLCSTTEMEVIGRPRFNRVGGGLAPSVL